LSSGRSGVKVRLPRLGFPPGFAGGNVDTLSPGGLDTPCPSDYCSQYRE
jgi:hypothetical protein